MIARQTIADSLLHTYMKLYPGKADVIMDAIKRGDEYARANDLKAADYMDAVEAEIQDVL